MAIYITSDSILLVARTWDFTCSPEEKVARIAGLQGGVYSVRHKYSVEFPNEEILGDMSIPPAPPVVPIYAFYHLFTKHYFITADPAERDQLINGADQGGWILADEGFNAWPAEGPAPTAAQPVCRFYSPAVNSYFYTASSGECEALKQPGSGWAYEGIAFRALVPTRGSCHSGTTPVWRLYNNRYAEADSNHRFVASLDTYRHMIASGWVGEGVAFCSPN